MTLGQQLVLLLYVLLNFYVFSKSFHEIKNKNVLGLAKPYGLIGIFVWGDAIIISPFWIIAVSIVQLTQDWSLFLFILSVFWIVRSTGEVIYWLNEQFASKNRNPPPKLVLYSFFGNDSVWFIYQLFWQCILVLSIIAAVYTGNLWLKHL
jgi:hypothetical protein